LLVSIYFLQSGTHRKHSNTLRFFALCNENTLPGKNLTIKVNMAEGGVSRSCDEQERLGQSVKTQQKYGTTTKTPSSAASPDLYVKHFVQKDETLPGIALKYGRSVG